MKNFYLNCPLECTHPLTVDLSSTSKFEIQVGQRAFLHSFQGPYVNIQLGKSIFDDLPYINMLKGDMDYYWRIDESMPEIPPVITNTISMIINFHPDCSGRSYSKFYIGYWAAEEKEKILNYVRNAPIKEAWKGSSSCRLCNKHLGSTDLGDETYLWPESFAHYINKHNIKPPSKIY